MTREPLIVETPALLQRVRAAQTSGASSDPYLKWVGSKQHLVRNHAHLLPDPKSVRHVHVPFAGAASVPLYYAAAGVPVTCSDTCEPLITTHLAVRDQLELLMEVLDAIERRGYSAETYYSVRDCLNIHKADLSFRRAAWFIVINKWGYNGLFRVNKKGECNTPFGKPGGTKPPKLYDAANLRACAGAFKKMSFEVLDFEAHAGRMATYTGLGSVFVYLDPPYIPKSATSAFTAYSADGFGLEDQKRLAALLPRLDVAGVRFALSQSDTPVSSDLFETPGKTRGWNTTRISRSGAVSSKAEERGRVGEILVRNYKNPGES